jgi:ATP/maltotriose-dependent transcriptional regulator MalT
MRSVRHWSFRARLFLAAALCLTLGCAARRGRVHTALADAAESSDALAVSDALEALIDAGEATPADRKYAYEVVRQHEQPTASYAYARAVVTGRLVQQRGLSAARLVPDIERFARKSRELDPGFRDGAATRVLGKLYVMAPAILLDHGDSEQGLELLEQLVAARPDVTLNHLYLAEAYVTLGDPAPAAPHLCRCLAGERTLRPGEQALLRQLVASAGPPRCETPPVVNTEVRPPRRPRTRVTRTRARARPASPATGATAPPAVP